MCCYGAALEAPVAPYVVIQFVVDHLEHLPGLAAPENFPCAPSSQTTQHLLPLAIDRLLVERGYKAQLGPWSAALGWPINLLVSSQRTR
jgi:hypothetical protein